MHAVKTCLVWYMLQTFQQCFGSGFQISLDPVSTPVSRSKKECRKGFKSYLLEEILKIITKERLKLKKTTISYYKLS